MESTPGRVKWARRMDLERVLLWIGSGAGVEGGIGALGSGQGIWVGFPWFCKQFHMLRGSLEIGEWGLGIRLGFIGGFSIWILGWG